MPWGWGRGWGWRWMFWLTGLPGWMRWGYFAPWWMYAPPYTVVPKVAHFGNQVRISN
jgi:hypothetical protein